MGDPQGPAFQRGGLRGVLSAQVICSCEVGFADHTLLSLMLESEKGVTVYNLQRSMRNIGYD